MRRMSVDIHHDDGGSEFEEEQCAIVRNKSDLNLMEATYTDYNRKFKTRSLTRICSCRFLFCCRRRLSCMEVVILLLVLLTTIVTWRVLLKVHSFTSAFSSLDISENEANIQKRRTSDRNIEIVYDYNLECNIPNKTTLRTGHGNPCWKVDEQLICAPKALFLGFEGCYSEEMLSPLIISSGIIMVNKPINFKNSCPINYLKKYSSLFQDMELKEKKTQPLFFMSDARFLPHSFDAKESGDLFSLKVVSELPKLSTWFRQSTKVGLFLCDPVVRLLNQFSTRLQGEMEDITPHTIHLYVMKRLKKAEDCIEQFGITRCQLYRTDDVLYQHLLSGIYRTYINELYKFISPSQVQIIHTDPLNETSFSSAVNTLARFLKVYVDEEKLEHAKQKYKERLLHEEKLVQNLHSKTISNLRKFYWRFRSDLIKFLESAATEVK